MESKSSNYRVNSTNLPPHVTVSTQQRNDAVTPTNNVNNTPPDNDCCPICFGCFSVPCQTNCGHWFCGNCIWKFWNYSAAPKPCKCPICSSAVTKLNPEASLFQQDDMETNKVLQNVDKYNMTFVGGTRGLFRMLCGTPILMKRIIRQIMDPDARTFRYIMCLVVTLKMVLIEAIPNVPKGCVKIIFMLFDCAACLGIILSVVGLFHRRQVLQHVRDMAAAEAVVPANES